MIKEEYLRKRKVEKIKQLSEMKKSEMFSVTVRNMTFYFSSNKLKESFKRKIQESVSVTNQKLNRIYNFSYEFEMDDLALIRLYWLIEKRGFLIDVNGVSVTCLSQIKIEGKIKIVS